MLPSEIVPKYRSKIWVQQVPELAERLLETSYRLVCKTCTKQGRKLVEEIASELGKIFAVFHRESLKLVRRDNIYLKYMDYDEPMLLAGIHAVAKFSWNKLSVRSPGAKGGWVTLDGSALRGMAARHAIVSGVRRCLKLNSPRQRIKRKLIGKQGASHEIGCHSSSSLLSAPAPLARGRLLWTRSPTLPTTIRT